MVGINNGKPLIGFIDPVGKVFVPDFLIPKILAQHYSTSQLLKTINWNDGLPQEPCGGNFQSKTGLNVIAQLLVIFCG